MSIEVAKTYEEMFEQMKSNASYKAFLPHVEEYISTIPPKELNGMTINSVAELGSKAIDHFIRTPMSNFTSKIDGYLAYGARDPVKFGNNKNEALSFIPSLINFLIKVPAEVWKVYDMKNGTDSPNMLFEMRNLLKDLLQLEDNPIIEELDPNLYSKINIESLSEAKKKDAIIHMLYIIHILTKKNLSYHINGILNESN